MRFRATGLGAAPFCGMIERSENMDNQHKKISGYRDLSEEEIIDMNAIKNLEAQFNGMIDYMRDAKAADQRQISIAATSGEEAFMRLVRAIAKPDRQVSQYIPFVNSAP